MACLIKLFVLLASIEEVNADLIGFNRLGNNVSNFHRFLNGKNIDFQLTNYQSMMENTVLTMEQKKELLNFLAQETPRYRGRKRNQQSLKNYVRRPFLTRRKTNSSTGKRGTRSFGLSDERAQARSTRLNAYKRRMTHKLQI